MKKVLFLVIIFAALSAAAFFFLKNFKIGEITCNSQYGKCESHLQADILTVKNRNIIETRNKLDEVLKKDTSVASYYLRFSLPNNFDVNIIEKKAVTAFIDKDGRFVLADSDGEIVGNVSDTSLPKITSYIDLTADEFKYIANLMSTIYTFYGNTNGKVTADGFEIDGIQGKNIIFPIEGDKDILLGSLALILSRLPSVKEASTIMVIDLRFKNPVLR